MKNVPFVVQNEEPRIRKIIENLIRYEFLPTPSVLSQQRKVELDNKRSKAIEDKKRKLALVEEAEREQPMRKRTARQIALSKK